MRNTSQSHCRRMSGRRSSSSSSGEEDGDAEWRAAIKSVTSSATFGKQNFDGFPPSSGGSENHGDEAEKHKPQNIKHYQVKAQKLLDNILDGSIELVSNMAHIPEKDPPQDDAGVRLFERAPPGIVFDHVDELHGPKKKPKIVPGEVFDEKSKKFRKRLQSVAIEGADIIALARAEGDKSLAKLEAREVAAKAAAKREEERIAELKRIRGERWLPSVAREMQMNFQRRR